jgi:hypothetical protein
MLTIGITREAFEVVKWDTDKVLVLDFIGIY